MRHRDDCGVSILIVVDVPLEVIASSLSTTSWLCFNPYCSGCTAGSVDFECFSFPVIRVSILIVVDVPLEAL